MAPSDTTKPLHKREVAGEPGLSELRLIPARASRGSAAIASRPRWPASSPRIRGDQTITPISYRL